ncbi:hypothetical protein WN943_006628 [Citrus x changshan-huyou]
MATHKILMTTILFTLTILLCFPTTPAGIPTSDLDAVLLLLHAGGHTLFANAIATSDLLFDLLSLPSLTLFAPTDPSLFAVDMTQTPPFYLSILRLHVLPLRLSWTELLQLISPSNNNNNSSRLPTLLPSRDLHVTRGDSGALLVGGVQVVMPGLYYSSYVAVHGLAGILTFRSPINNNHSNGNFWFRPLNHTAAFPPPPLVPRIQTNPSPVNPTIVSPSQVPIPASFPVLSPAPGPEGLHGYTPAESPEGHVVLTGKPIKHKKAKQDTDRTSSSNVNDTVPVPPLANAPRTPTNRKNRTDSSPVNHHTVVSPSQTIPASSSPIDSAVVVSPPALAPSRGSASLFGYFLAEPAENQDVLTLDSPSPAPMTNDLKRSRKIREVFVGGEICAVG